MDITTLGTCVAIVALSYMVGTVSGLAATGVNQMYKQAKK